MPPPRALAARSEAELLELSKPTFMRTTPHSLEKKTPDPSKAAVVHSVETRDAAHAVSAAAPSPRTSSVTTSLNQQPTNFPGAERPVTTFSRSASLTEAEPALDSDVATGMPEGAGSWNIPSWVSSIDGISEPLSQAVVQYVRKQLCLPSDEEPPSIAALAELRQFGADPAKSAADFRTMLEDANVLDALAEALFSATRELTVNAASANELHSKFMLMEPRVLKYGGLSSFFKGLEGLLGPPATDLVAAVRREHTKMRDTALAFVAGNYGTKTTSEIEYHFVTDPDECACEFQMLSEDGWSVVDIHADGWPGEAKLAADDPTRRRPRAIETFTQELHARDEQLTQMGMEPLLELEFVAARLYTGPLYVKYNAVLRSKSEMASKDAHARSQELCRSNSYPTTLHVINSAVGKLAKLTTAEKVYRGVSGGVLPEGFLLPNEHNVRGGIELSFMSCTQSREVASSYAMRKGRDQPALCFEIQMGMVDRGASLSWLSQYPHEREILFAPLCGMEVQSLRVDGATIVVVIKLSVNLRDPSIEKMQAKMQSSHLQLINMMLDELSYFGAPRAAVAPLRIVHERVKAKPAAIFNDAEEYSRATSEALRAQKEVFTLLGDRKLWLESTPGATPSSTGGVTPTANGAESEARRISGAAPDTESGATGAKVVARAGKVLWKQARALHGLAQQEARMLEASRAHRKYDLSQRQLASARLCARSGYHATAIKLLEMSVSQCPLEETMPELAALVAAVSHAAGLSAEQIDEHGWRLEAATLTDGMSEPWPETLVHLITELPEASNGSGGSGSDLEERSGCDPQASIQRQAAARHQSASGLEMAFAMICANQESRMRFGPRARVLAWWEEQGRWAPATVMQVQAARVHVRLDSGKRLHALARSDVLAPGSGGSGAVLRGTARLGRVRLLKALLVQGVSPFECTEDASTALHFAAGAGQIECCKLLLQWGADSFRENTLGFSALQMARQSGYTECARVFEPTCANQDLTDFACRASLLLRAAGAASADASLAGVRAALATDAGLAMVDEHFSNGVTPLMVAARSCNVAVVHELVNAKADLLQRSRLGASTLKIAVESAVSAAVEATLNNSHFGGFPQAPLDTVQALLEADLRRREALDEAEPSSPAMFQAPLGGSSPSGGFWSPAALAARRRSGSRGPRTPGRAGWRGAVELVSVSTKLVDVADENGVTPLMTACMAFKGGKFTQLVELLLQAEASVNQPDHNGRTALMFACSIGNPTTVDLLLSAGADPTLELHDSGHTCMDMSRLDMCYWRTALEACAAGARSRTMEALLKHPTCATRTSELVNQQSAAGTTALMCACRFGAITCAVRLLELGANLELLSDGHSALHIACASQDKLDEIVQLMISKHADVDGPTVGGTSPLMLAARGRPKILQVLLDEGANVDYIRPKYEDTALISAAMAGSAQCTQQLLKAKAALEVADCNGMTALSHAAQKGAPRVLLELLARSADPNLAANNGLTPLMLAVKMGHPRAVQTILKVASAHELQLDATDARGRTALQLARTGRLGEHERFVIVNELLAAGATDSMDDGVHELPLSQGVSLSFGPMQPDDLDGV